MNPLVLPSIQQFLNNDELETLELEFSIFNTILADSSFRMKNLPSKRSFWKIFVQKSILGNVTFYFRDGPKFVFALVVDDEYLSYQITEKNFVIEKFIVLGADPISGTKITITDDSFRVNANINNQGSFLTQEYKNCLSIKGHKEKLNFETLTKNPEGSDNCYIATLVYEDSNHPKVNVLRKYRNEILSQNLAGRLFIKLYYFSAPKLIILLKPLPAVQKKIKKALDFLTTKLEKKEV
jgi:hypothetical protein